MSDFVIIFYWYLILVCFGLGWLPLTALFFPKFKDKGYGFSRTLAILSLSYIVWLLGSLKVFNFQWLGIWIMLIVALPWAVVLVNYPRIKKEMVNNFKQLWSLWLWEELLFLLALIGWSWIRSYQPNIEGLEKYMDVGFVNSILRSGFMPPQDTWLSGFTINYYYFGHFITAFLTKISGLPSQYSYNLMMATVFSSGVLTAFSFGFNFIYVLVKKNAGKSAVFTGLLAAFLVNLTGNLHTVVYAFRRGVVYWYPDATRYIGYNPDVADKTIHEFPLYSYVVADLHGHMINIPHAIVTVAVIFYILHFVFKSADQTKKIAYAAFLALLLAVSFITNSWDLPTYFCLFAGNLAVITFLRHKQTSQRAFEILFYPLVVLVLWFIFTLPYQLNFTNFAKGIEPTWSHSLWYQLLVLWGFFAWFSISYFVFHLARFWQKKNFAKMFDLPLLFPVGLAFLAFGLIAFCEFFYLKDIYIKEHYRANTMFKLGYQAFIILSLASAVTTGYFLHLKAQTTKAIVLKKGWFLISLALILAVGVYPYFAIKGYYGDFKTRQSLNGWNYLKTNYIGDHNAILWLKQNVVGQPVVLEAVGDSYTIYARISTNTGLPTVLGWPVHEWLWRGSYDLPGARTTEVQQIYESTDILKLQALLQKYRIKYIVVGKLEQDKYPKLNINNIKQVSSLVFADSGTAIYEVK